MTEEYIKNLEEYLISIGEDREYITQLKETYKMEYKTEWLEKYILHLEEIEKIYVNNYLKR